MAGTLNRATLIGNLGRDPELPSTQSSARIVMLSLATWISATLMAMILIIHGALSQESSDTVSRASFCKGALDKGIELFSLSNFSDAQQKAIAAKTLDAFTQNRERLQRFLLPYMTDQNQRQSLMTAMLEGARLYKECDETIRSSGAAQAMISETCTRVVRCFNLDWLPELEKK